MLDVLSLDELEPMARARLPRMAFDYIAGGAEDEWTLQENRAAFQRLQLIPRVLIDVTERDLATTVLGARISLPVLVAPMAFHSLTHTDGELATARAAAAAGTIMIASTASNYSMEEIAASCTASRWFQLYIYRDRELTRSLVERAATAGYEALCVTVDAPLIGRRPRDARNQFSLPAGITMGNFKEAARADLPETERESGLAAYVASQWDAGVTWKDVEWLRSISGLPVVLKGILSTEDARLAVEHGAAGIVVSNHGGRQLDTAPASITVLPHIVEAVQGRIEILLDGGIRRGTDVLKALALGARACLLGRPVLWGLALEGEEGARAVLDILRVELDSAMALAGCRRIEEVTSALILKT
ncbi:MAG: alpha-hydroxy-acid oxidizing enzyme [Acidobacteria bacterium 13_1_20CM_3_53_8]|nr:MAG: alpha-hydroxy-acid oxidizing enzyme [Acidobacteria bacterium 13_1_20CM_3_53_8]